MLTDMAKKPRATSKTLQTSVSMFNVKDVTIQLEKDWTRMSKHAVVKCEAICPTRMAVQQDNVSKKGSKSTKNDWKRKKIMLLQWSRGDRGAEVRVLWCNWSSILIESLFTPVGSLNVVFLYAKRLERLWTLERRLNWPNCQVPPWSRLWPLARRSFGLFVWENCRCST